MTTAATHDRTFISLDEWRQAAVTTALHTLETTAGRTLSLPADEWTAAAEPTDDGGSQGYVCGPLATAHFRCCADPAHWPASDRLAEAVAAAPPLRGNWLQRQWGKLRPLSPMPPVLSLQLPPTAGIGAGHTVCWNTAIIPSLIGLQIAADPARD